MAPATGVTTIGPVEDLFAGPLSGAIAAFMAVPVWIVLILAIGLWSIIKE